MYRNHLALIAAAFSLQACFKGDASSGTCTVNTDCATGSTCNLALHVCEYACPQLCAANEQCVSGACVALDCLPACDTNHFCDKNQTPPKCIELTSGTASLTKPHSGDVVGSNPLSVEATAGAPGTGPTQVVFRVEQGGVSKATSTVTAGTVGDYSGTLTIAGNGLVPGAAKVFASTYYTVNGTETNIDSPAIDVVFDLEAPLINTPTTDHSFYSSTATTPAPNATVTVQINDKGAAGVDKTTVQLRVGSHSYPPAIAPAVADGHGTYSFTVPTGDIGIGTNGQASVGFVVSASDKVSNAASFYGGSIAIDNNPPVFTNAVLSTTQFYGGDAGIPIAVDVADPDGGSGLDSSSVAMFLADNTTKFIPALPINPTAAFLPLGSDLQIDGQQGPVTIHFTASDNVHNTSTSTTQTVQVDRKPPSIRAAIVTDNTASNNGYYPRDAAVTIPVSATVDDGPTGSGGSGVKAVTLSVAGVKVEDGALDTGSGKWLFAVRTTLAATTGFEGPVAFTLTATDNAGNTVANVVPTGSPAFKIDDKGPSVGAPTIIGGIVGQDGNPWFAYDATATLDITSIISDAGSGLKASTIKVLKAGVQIDDGSPGISGSTYTFHVRRNLLGPNQENTVSFTIVAQDNLLHGQQAASTGIFGLDGAKPTVAFATVTYPTAGTGCFSDPTVFCGHDGSRFYRNESGTLSYTVTDMGAGVSASGGSCTTPGAHAGSCQSATFSLPVTFNGAMTTDTHGNGTITVPASGHDLVNNLNSGSTDVAITRAKWVNIAPVAGLGALAGSPILTSLPVPQIIVGGFNNAGDPIVALSTAGTTAATLPGAKRWSAGHSLSTTITSVTSNMAYDPTASTDVTHPTPVLYVNSGSLLYALHVTASAVDKYCLAPLNNIVGAPVLVGAGATAKAIIAGGGRIDAVSTVLNAGAGACSVDGLTNITTSGMTPAVGPPSANGTNIYFGYDNSANVNNDRGIGSVTFSGGNFGTPTTTNLSFEPTTNTAAAAIAVPDDLFFGNNFSHVFYRYGTNNVQKWPSSPALADNIFAPPTLSGGLVFASSSALYAYKKSDGTKSWQYPAAGALTQVTPPTVGADGSLYFSDSNKKEIVAIDSAQALKWTYAGAATTSPVTTLSSIATEATLGADGTLYFGDSNGKVYALITDTTPATTVAGDWPKTGYDNCNSGNANNPGYTCQ